MKTASNRIRKHKKGGLTKRSRFPKIKTYNTTTEYTYPNRKQYRSSLLDKTYLSPELIGQGTFGCVYSPPMKCKHRIKNLKQSSDKGKNVSKLMRYQDAVEELSSYDMIEEIDPLSKFHLGKPQICEVARTEDKKTCSVRDVDTLLISKNGGKDLKQFLKMIEEINEFSMSEFENIISDLFVSSLTIFEAISVLLQNQIIHHDIKPSNLVYEMNTKAMRLIDFGHMRRFKDDHTHKYWFNYPIECQLVDLTPEEVSHYKVDDVKSLMDMSYVATFETKEHYLQRLNFGLNASVDFLFTGNFQNNQNILLNKLQTTFDSYSLGMSLMYVLKKLQNFEEYFYKHIVFLQNLWQLFQDMMDFNVLTRISITEATNEFKYILQMYNKIDV